MDTQQTHRRRGRVGSSLSVGLGGDGRDDRIGSDQPLRCKDKPDVYRAVLVDLLVLKNGGDRTARYETPSPLVLRS